MAFFPAHATDLSWSVAVARAVELSPAAVAFAVLSSDAADPAVEFAPFASDVAVEFVDAAEAAFDDDPEAVEVDVEASTAVEDACAPSTGADAVAVELFAPELAAAPVGLPVLEVEVLLPDALAAAGPPEEVVDAVAGVGGLSPNPPPLALAVVGLPSSCVPALLAPAPPDCSEPLLEPAPAPVLAFGKSEKGSGLTAAVALVLLVEPLPVAVPGAVEVDAVAEGGVVSPPLPAPAAADAAASAGVVAVAGT